MFSLDLDRYLGTENHTLIKPIAPISVMNYSALMGNIRNLRQHDFIYNILNTSILLFKPRVKYCPTDKP